MDQKPQIISWQFIVLIGVLAVLITVVALGNIPVARPDMDSGSSFYPGAPVIMEVASSLPAATQPASPALGWVGLISIL